MRMRIRTSYCACAPRLRPYTHEPDKLSRISEIRLRDEAIMSRDPHKQKFANSQIAEEGGWRPTLQLELYSEYMSQKSEEEHLKMMEKLTALFDV